MARYSRFARMQGGSRSSSAMELLLATMMAPGAACAKADRALAETLAYSRIQDQLSQDKLCQLQ